MSVLDMEWFELDSPASLAIVVEILVFFLFKPIVVNIFESAWKKNHTEPFPNPWAWRDITMNLICFGLSWGFATWRLWGEQAGVIFVTGLLAGVIASGGYETIKNALRVANIDIGKFQYKR